MKRETEEKATPEIIYFVDGGGRRFAERPNCLENEQKLRR